MEPMNLGSPVNSPSPAGNQSAYLPPFLLGDPQAATTPRSNTLSPNKNTPFGSFSASPAGANSMQEFNRSTLNQKSLFGGYQTMPQGGGANNYPGTPMPSHSGPPTQGLFDSLRNDQYQVHTPRKNAASPHQHSLGSIYNNNAGNASATNYSIGQQSPLLYNDSYAAIPSVNPSMRTFCSPLGANMSPVMVQSTAMNQQHVMSDPAALRYADFWVTVYGFPPNATSMILQHFTICGTIVDKVLAPQNGNWIHLKFSSRIECDRALNYSEKLLNNNIMIGVTRCTDRTIIEKENANLLCDRDMNKMSADTPRPLRSLAQYAYKHAQGDTAVVPNNSVAQKSSGLMNRAMDLFFGW